MFHVKLCPRLNINVIASHVFSSVTPSGVRLCRPSELVLEILPLPQQGAFTKEDGEAVIDANGQPVN